MMAVNERPKIRRKVHYSWERRAIRFALGLVLILAMPVAGQSPYSQFPSTNNGKLGRNYPDTNSQFGADPNADPRRIRMLNSERQKELVSDTQKLLQLARELNAEVSDANAAAMTDAQLRKVAEIAKLARSVKEKMTFSLGGYPNLKSPPTFDNHFDNQ
jgi:hypothetical protein